MGEQIMYDKGQNPFVGLVFDFEVVDHIYVTIDKRSIVSQMPEDIDGFIKKRIVTELSEKGVEFANQVVEGDLLHVKLVIEKRKVV